MRWRWIGRLACLMTAVMIVGARWGGEVTARAAGPEIAIRLFQFRPGSLPVTAGAHVTWTNGDDIAHTVTAGTPDQPRTDFRATLDGKGTSTSVTFPQPGVYPYFCERHHHMRGEIRVD